MTQLQKIDKELIAKPPTQITSKKNRRWGPPENKSKGSFKGTLTLIAGSRVSSAVLQNLCSVM
jgi:hypothetical protein